MFGLPPIPRYLLKYSANIAAVNSDGDVPLDIAEDDCMETLLRAEIEKRGKIPCCLYSSDNNVFITGNLLHVGK